MFKNSLLVFLQVLLFISCKRDYFNSSNLNDSFNTTDTLACTQFKIDSIEVLDSFSIEDYLFLTIQNGSKIELNNKILDSGTFLLNFKKGSLININNKDEIFKSFITSYRIDRDYSDKKYFFNLNKEFDINSQLQLKYAYPFPVADAAETFVLYVQNDTIKELFNVLNWNYYYEDLFTEKVTDSTYSIKYKNRDRFGFFHDDYTLLLKIRPLKVELKHPEKQFIGYKRELKGDIVFYKLKGKVLFDTLVLKKGSMITLDSVLWNTGLFKIHTLNGNEGYIRIENIPSNIDGDNAG